MVHMIRMNRRIMGAFLVGFGLIGGAFLLARQQVSPATGSLAVVSSAAAPREFLRVTDSDTDGIPDWQEALQRTEPLMIDSTDSTYTPPETLTDQFARDFFEDMVRSKGYGEFGADQTEVIERATKQFQAEAADELFSTEDIVISNDTSVSAKRTYVNALATIMLDHSLPANAPSEVEILKRAYDTNNPEVLKELAVYIDGYTDMVDRTKSTPVPSDYQSAHLDLLNAMNAVRVDITAMQEAFTDPLRTVIRLKRMQEDATAMYLTILNLQKQVTADGIQFVSTDPVWRLFTQ